MDPATLAPLVVQVVVSVLENEQPNAAAQRVWKLLEPVLSKRPTGREVVVDIKANPSDEDLQAALRVQVRKLIADDKDLAAELTGELGATAGASVSVSAAGARSVAVGSDITGSIIVTGDRLSPF